MAGILDGSGPLYSGPLYGGAVPYGSHQGLMLRAVGCPDEIRLQIDPVDGDLDHEVGGLPGQVHHLRNVDREARNHSHTANQLHLTLIKARAGVKNIVRTLNRSTVPYGSANAIHFIVYALVCFFSIYLWYKLSG